MTSDPDAMAATISQGGSRPILLISESLPITKPTYGSTPVQAKSVEAHPVKRGSASSGDPERRAGNG